MSTPGCSARTCCGNVATACASATSRWCRLTCVPAVASSAAVRVERVVVDIASAEMAAAAGKRRAIARPIPPAAPVTTAVRPENFSNVELSVMASLTNDFSASPHSKSSGPVRRPQASASVAVCLKVVFRPGKHDRRYRHGGRTFGGFFDCRQGARRIVFSACGRLCRVAARVYER